MAQQTNELAAVVVQTILKELPDALARSTPFWNYLTSKEGKLFVDGSLFLQAAIKLLVNQSSGFISGTNAIVSATPSLQLQHMELNWKYYNTNTNFTLEDYTIASGEAQKLNFIREKINGAIQDASRELSIAGWGTSASDPLQFEGMADITAASGVSYAGLNNVDYPDNPDAYLPFTSTETILDYGLISQMTSKLRARMQKNNDINAENKYCAFMNESIYARWMGIIQDQQIFYTPGTKVEVGFDSFVVNGVEFFLDADCPGSQDGSADNHLYIIPKKNVQLWYRFGLDKRSPFTGDVRLPLQPIQSMQTYLVGNMIARDRRLIAVNKTIIAG